MHSKRRNTILSKTIPLETKIHVEIQDDTALEMSKHRSNETIIENKPLSNNTTDRDHIFNTLHDKLEEENKLGL
jgi:hypothetical protein